MGIVVYERDGPGVAGRVVSQAQLKKVTNNTHVGQFGAIVGALNLVMCLAIDGRPPVVGTPIPPPNTDNGEQWAFDDPAIGRCILSRYGNSSSLVLRRGIDCNIRADQYVKQTTDELIQYANLVRVPAGIRHALDPPRYDSRRNLLPDRTPAERLGHLLELIVGGWWDRHGRPMPERACSLREFY